MRCSNLDYLIFYSLITPLNIKIVKLEFSLEIKLKRKYEKNLILIFKIKFKKKINYSYKILKFLISFQISYLNNIFYHKIF